MSAKDLRTKTRDILERAKFRGEHFVVESFGKPMVAIIGSDEYRAVPADAAGSHSSPDRCQTWRKSRPPYLDCDG
ncbi:MAG TPA: hypothetical protein VM537_22235 [Anaerolineae bacterium]|nr:hypothetical protein [Anaerolineae bacterium]